MHALFRIALAPVQPLTRFVVWFYGRAFTGSASFLMPLAEAFCWFKTVLYAALAALLLYVLATLDSTTLARPDAPWVVLAAVGLTYLTMCLTLGHRDAALHFRQLRLQKSKLAST